MLRVIDVDYLKDYTLLCTFSDGQRKKVNLEPYLTGEVFGELIDRDKFIQYGLTPVTIQWVNGADLAPEFLYSIGENIKYSDTESHASCVADDNGVEYNK